jgi:hypothetical protein
VVLVMASLPGLCAARGERVALSPQTKVRIGVIPID